MPDIAVPDRYSRTPDQSGVSDRQRYKDAYDDAWWACIERYVVDIAYRPLELDRAGNGWPAAVRGYEDGYRAAESRVQSLKNQYGPVRTQEILKKATANQPSGSIR